MIEFPCPLANTHKERKTNKRQIRWRHVFKFSLGLITDVFVYMSSSEIISFLSTEKMTRNDNLVGVPLMLLANKQDLEVKIGLKIFFNRYGTHLRNVFSSKPYNHFL